MHYILLLEDKPDRLSDLREALLSSLGRDYSIEVMIKTDFSDLDRSYEDIICDRINNLNTKGDVVIIISDLDLSQISRGLSESAATTSANRLSIPIALYAQGHASASRDILEKKEIFGNARIVLDDTKFNTDASALVKGFAKIRNAFVAKISDEELRQPSKLIARLLGNDDVADALSMYGVSDQQIVSGLMAQSKGDGAISSVWSTVGYWIIDTLLKYPGLLVNEIAAASYLNIDPDHFTGEIRDVFKNAIYDGPFAGYQSNYWWRGKLDDLLCSSKAKDGNELASRIVNHPLPFCRCFVDQEKKAGYYCMVEGKPVSLEESYGLISWFPAGADLARINKNTYDQRTPFMGLM